MNGQGEDTNTFERADHTGGRIHEEAAHGHQPKAQASDFDRYQGHRSPLDSVDAHHHSCRAPRASSTCLSR